MSKPYDSFIAACEKAVTPEKAALSPEFLAAAKTVGSKVSRDLGIAFVPVTLSFSYSFKHTCRILKVHGRIKFLLFKHCRKTVYNNVRVIKVDYKAVSAFYTASSQS